MKAEDFILLVEQGKRDQLSQYPNALELIVKRFREFEKENNFLNTENDRLSKANSELCSFPPEYKSYQEFLDSMINMCNQAEKDSAQLLLVNECLEKTVEELKSEVERLSGRSIYKVIKAKLESLGL